MVSQKEVDAAALCDDGMTYNAGFIIIKPTKNSILLYRTLQANLQKPGVRFEQQALNSAVRNLKKQSTGIEVTFLNRQRFRDGSDYFEKPQRYFAQKRRSPEKKPQSNDILVVHNNCIVSKAAKVYRYRENLMWMYDGDDQYYTSQTRLYLAYNNQVPFFPLAGFSKVEQAAVTSSEIFALKAAMTIGYLLNRTVILPRFHAGPKAVEVPLNFILHMASFDKHFAGNYRENSFLWNPKVPYDVKSKFLKHQFVESSTKLASNLQNVTISNTYVVRQFGGIEDRVLTFPTLHYVFVTLTNTTKNNAFIGKLEKGFFRSSYRQYRRW